MTPETQIIWFTLLGFLGGFTHVFTDSKAWGGLLKFESIKQMIIGGISGGLYWMLYTNHGFPNLIMAFVVGYTGTDFIVKLIEKYAGEEIEDEQ